MAPGGHCFITLLHVLPNPHSLSLFMKEEAYDYLEENTIKDLVKKYSQFINFPIHLWTSKTEQVRLLPATSSKYVLCTIYIHITQQ